MAEDSIPAYITETGKEDRDLRSGNSTTTSARKIDNAPKFTDWASKKYTHVTGSEIIKNYNINNFKSSYNKSITLDIDPEQKYWFNRDKQKIGGLANSNFEKYLVSEIEDTKIAQGVDTIAENMGAKNNLLDDTAKAYNINPKVLGGFIARGGAAWLDPVTEVAEVALGKIGLGGLAAKWMKGELYALAASAIAGLAVAGTDYAGKQMANTTGKAVMNLSIPGYADNVETIEPEFIDSLIEGADTFATLQQYTPATKIYDASKEVVDAGKDYLKTGMSSVLGAFGGE